MSKEKKQTAVEWLIQELGKKLGEFDFLYEFQNEISKAKEMEKRELYKFYIQGGINACIGADRTVEDYYKEAYEK